MSIINLTRKESCISTLTPPIIPPKNNLNNEPTVSILLTESIANELNISAKPLQPRDDTSTKSKICVLFETPSKKQVNDAAKPFLSDDCAFFRLVPMEESSTSVAEMDDLSDVNDLLQNQTEFHEKKCNILYLGPCFIQTSSIMVVCSMAHDNKLVTESNKIFIKVTLNSSTHWINKCRICYGTISSEELIRPCDCKGSVACAHLSCLEHWLRESGRNYCELCKHNFQVLRTPKYGLLKSVMVWLSSPGEHTPLLIEDLISFALYTPAAVCSTYILMLLSENALRNASDTSGHAANLITFFAFAGIAAIDFTYSSWLMVSLQRHLHAWRHWYRESCCLTLILPPRKSRSTNIINTTSEID